MVFTATALGGAYLIEPERQTDERGFFARTWSRDEFDAHGLDPRIAQCSISFNTRKGTLRGMHYQTAPFAESKLVRCTRGAIYDVIIDLRPDSRTFTRWIAVELTAANRLMLYVPEGFANGFQTLEDETEVCYQISEEYSPQHGRGVRWDDPVFGIAWPAEPTIMASRDRAYPDYRP